MQISFGKSKKRERRMKGIQGLVRRWSLNKNNRQDGISFTDEEKKGAFFVVALLFVAAGGYYYYTKKDTNKTS